MELQEPMATSIGGEDIDISALDAQPEVVELERSSPAARGVASTVSRIPPETLSEIFLWLRDRTMDAPHFYDDRKAMKVLQIAHVCSKWRVSALACSALWAHITSNMRVKWMEIFLHRSRDAFLTVNLQFASAADMPPPDGRDAILACLAPHFHRVRSLCVSESSSFNVFDILSFPSAGFPFLTHLDVYAREHVPGTPLSAAPITPRRDSLFPRLKSASFCEFIGWPYVAFAPSLTELTVDMFSIHHTLPDALNALERLVRLESLTLSGFALHESSRPGLPLVVMKNLRRLTLVDTAGQTTTLLRFLSFPRLHQLSAHILFIPPHDDTGWRLDRNRFSAHLLDTIEDFCTNVAAAGFRLQFCSVTYRAHGKILWRLGCSECDDRGPSLDLTLRYDADDFHNNLLPVLQDIMPLDGVLTIRTDILRSKAIEIAFPNLRNWHLEGHVADQSSTWSSSVVERTTTSALQRAEKS